MASKFANEYSYSYGDNLAAVVETNIIDEVRLDRQSFIESFQNELLRVHQDMRKADALEQQQKRQEQEFYQDILDGIIVL